MYKKYEVIWTNTADGDLSRIIDYIAQDSINNAIDVFDKIKNKCSNLYICPNRGRIVPELRDYGILLYRELIIGTWRVMYRITENHVFVLSVIDSRQNVEDILLSRFVNK
ncbi:MAG: type II toxin-antitoxin system RelE/ParE family toxin [Candidatus Omnitrophica bacterium]|nr:type II toxin-antitoxin system RelE/ParE family toxin [Candidatus Omnitrophota bacterium]